MAEDSKPVGGSIWMRKYGPWPLWAYAAVLLVLAAAWRIWQSRKDNAAQAAAQQTGVDLIGGDQNPPVVFQSYTNITGPLVPPGAGRDHPPVHTPPPQPHPNPPPAPHDPVVTPVPRPAPTPAPPAPPPPSGQWVTVGRWTASNPPWNSTLWGIATHFGYGGANWGAIWNASQNSSLRARRGGDPKKIQPGDQIWVPAR